MTKKNSSSTSNRKYVVFTLLTITISALIGFFSSTILQNSNMNESPSYYKHSQWVIWNSSYKNQGPGIEVSTKYSYWPLRVHNFVPWEELKSEIASYVFPRFNIINDSIDRFSLFLKPTNGNVKDLKVQIICDNDTNKVIAHIWYGWNPWGDGPSGIWDGLIRVGTPGEHYGKNVIFKHLWGTFIRCSDGRYVLTEDKSAPDSVKCF